MDIHSKVTQLFLPERELAQGLLAFSLERPEIDFGHEQVMHVARDLAFFEQTYGLVFQESSDDLGALQLALLRLPSGTFVTLMCRRHITPHTINVCVGNSCLRTFGTAMTELMNVLALPESEVEWKIGCLRVHLRSEFLERHLVALHQADGAWIPLARLKSPPFKGDRNSYSFLQDVFDEGKDVRMSLYHFWSGASLALRQTLGHDQRTELCLPERYHGQHSDILREAIAVLELDPQDFLWGNP